MTQFAICCYRPWNLAFFKDFNLITDKDDLETKLSELSPEWVFFLDWSWTVPLEVIKKYKCVCFHESDLPNFRGGSPIQNQIVKGIKKTKLTAFLMDERLDTGDILLQEDLSLEGHLMDIFNRVLDLTPRMISRILQGDYVRRKQEGKGSYFPRRRPESSEFDELLFSLQPLKVIYDHIRMLEDPYPNAFLMVGDRKIIFKSAEMKGKLTALVEIE